MHTPTLLALLALAFTTGVHANHGGEHCPTPIFDGWTAETAAMSSDRLCRWWECRESNNVVTWGNVYYDCRRGDDCVPGRPRVCVTPQGAEYQGDVYGKRGRRDLPAVQEKAWKA